MLTSARRLALSMVVCVVGAGAGSALLASPALAGTVNTDNGYLNGALYNATPYTWIKVAQGSPQPCYAVPGNPQYDPADCWAAQEPPATIAPGGRAAYTVESNLFLVLPLQAVIKIGYDAWVTYRVDVLGGAPEYVTYTVSQCACNDPIYGPRDPRLDVWDTTAPPPSGYDPGTNSASPAPETAKPQVTYAHNVPQLFDQTFQIAGNYMVDASTDLGAPFVGVLNALCSGATNTSCSFTQTGPLTWGIGTAVKKVSAENCTVQGPVKGGGSAPGVVRGEPPPALDPNWIELEYEEAQSATLSVGGSLAVGAEFNLFGSISGKITVKVEAEHEWQEVKSLTKTTRVYVPSNDIAAVWVAPVVGKVTGTLVVSNGSATFTATNFTETRSGVSKNDLTPAFNVITRVRPLTASEYAADCHAQSLTGLGSTKSFAFKGRPSVRLVAGRGVARVELGQTQAQVLRQLGEPSVRLFSDQACRGLDPRCGAVPARGGIWMYRHLSVMFGIDRQVNGLIYRGAQRSARGVGVGSGLAAVRRAFPGVSCTSAGKRRDCTLRGALDGQAVKTVFRLIATGGGRYKCDRVLIYLVDPRSGQVGA